MGGWTSSARSVQGKQLAGRQPAGVVPGLEALVVSDDAYPAVGARR